MWSNNVGLVQESEEADGEDVHGVSGQYVHIRCVVDEYCVILDRFNSRYTSFPTATSKPYCFAG